MLKIALFVAISVVFAMPSFAASGGHDIVLVLGQSNAAGWGKGGYGMELEASSHRLLQWNWNSESPVETAQDPICVPCEKNARKIRGFVLPFANSYAANSLQSERSLLLINAAVGGSNLSQWAPGKPFYTRAIEAAHDALKLNSDNRIVAVLWHQGEADIKLAAQNSEWKKQKSIYGMNLRNLVLALRADLPSDGVIPFLAGEGSREWSEAEAIRDAFFSETKSVLSTLPKTAFVTSENLTGNKNDKIHFDGPSQAELGRRYFAQFSKLTRTRLTCESIFDGGSK